MTSPVKLPRSSLGKGLQAVAWCLAHPARTARSIGRGLALAYRERVAARSPLPVVRLRDLVGWDTVVTLSDFEGRDGNVSLYELLVIAALVQHHAPRTLLEIGTFDGNTTLQLAHNSPPDARVFTLDLPPDPGAARGRLERADLAYIEDGPKRVRRKFERSPLAAKITQWLGDSATFDLGEALGGRPVDFAFIDGSHSYDYVRNDTERVLALLAPDGLMLWHDFTPAWPGVVEYLSERAADLPLRRIAGTNLVCLRRA